MLNTVTEVLNPRIIINLFKDVQDVIQNTLGLEAIVQQKKLYIYILSLFTNVVLCVFFLFSLAILVTQFRFDEFIEFIARMY